MTEKKEAKKKEVSIEDLPGIGPASAEKLREAGFGDLMSIAVASIGDLTDIAGLTEAAAKKVVNAARNKLDMGFESGLDLLKKREQVIKITTGSKALDTLFGGGVETGAITETYGAYGSGKTSLAHQLAVSVQLPKDKGGAEGIAVWLDTEGTLRPEFISKIAKANGLDPEEALKNFRGVRVFNSDHQVLVSEKIEDLIKQGLPVKLVVVDSMMGHFRSEFVGRGTLANRQQRLNKHMHQLLKLAQNHGIAVYITNQVMAKPDVFFGDPTEAVGGHVLHHACLRENTMLQLGDGSVIPINNLKGPTTMVSNDLYKDMKNKLSFCDKGVLNKSIRTILKIDTGNEIEVSAEHRFFRLKDFEIREIRAKEIKEGDYLVMPSLINIEGDEQKLPQIDYKSLVKLSKEGSEFLIKGIEDLKTNRNELCNNLNIKPRQLRRILNQGYPTDLSNINLLVQSGIDKNIYKYLEVYSSNKFREITIPERLTIELVQVLGYFIGDGTTNDNSLKFKDQRVEILQVYKNLIKNLFSLEGKINKVPEKNCFELVINSRVLVRLFRELKEKAFIYIGKSKNDHIRAFIKGFADAEGYVDKKRPRFIISQKDKLFLQGLQLLLLRLGIRSRLNVQKKKSKIEVTYNLLFDNRDFLGFAKEIGVTASDKKILMENMVHRVKKSVAREIFPIKVNEIWKILKDERHKPSEVLSNSCHFITKNKLEAVLSKLGKAHTKKSRKKIAFIKKILDAEVRFEKVRKITKQVNDEPLYDISIPVLENYIANGFLVHNSTYRVYFRRGKKGTRVAKLVDAPAMPDSETVFIVTDEGIKDVL